MTSVDDILEICDEGNILITETSAEELKKYTTELVRKVTGKGYYTIIITMNNPSSLLMNSFKRSGIDIEKVYFIDSITRYALGSMPEDEYENIHFISQPGNLTGIGIELNKSLLGLNEDKVCVIIDSINAMLIYVPSDTLTKFVHFVSNKLRLLHHVGIYISVSGSIDPLLLNQLKSFTDEFIEI